MNNAHRLLLLVLAAGNEVDDRADEIDQDDDQCPDPLRATRLCPADQVHQGGDHQGQFDQNDRDQQGQVLSE